MKHVSFGFSTEFQNHHQLQDALEFGLQLKVTSKFNRNAKVARALTGRRAVHLAADDDLEI